MSIITGHLQITLAITRALGTEDYMTVNILAETFPKRLSFTSLRVVYHDLGATTYE